MGCFLYQPYYDGITGVTLCNSNRKGNSMNRKKPLPKGGKEKLLLIFNSNSDLKQRLVIDALRENRSLNKQILSILENHMNKKFKGDE